MRQFDSSVVEFAMRELGLVPVAPEIFAMDRGKEPAFGLGAVAQLPAFRRAQEKGLLRQIRRQVLAPGQTERETVKRRAVLFDQTIQHQRTHKNENAPERSYSLLIGVPECLRWNGLSRWKLKVQNPGEWPSSKTQIQEAGSNQISLLGVWCTELFLNFEL